MRILAKTLSRIAHIEGSPIALLVACRCVFHSSIIPEVLCIDDDKDQQKTVYWLLSNRKFADLDKILCLFAQCETMQFTSRLNAPQAITADIFVNKIFVPVLQGGRYFTTTLQTCEITNLRTSKLLLPHLVHIRSLTTLVIWCSIDDEDLNVLTKLQSKVLTELRLMYGASVSRKAQLELSAKHQFTSVRTLALSRFSDSCAMLRAFPNLTKLRLMGHDDTIILDVESLVASVPELRILYISSFTIPCLDPLADLCHLNEITITSCKELGSLKFLSSLGDTLTVCCMPYNEWADDDDQPPLPEILGNLRHLKKLSLGRNRQMHNDTMKAIGSSMIALEELHINGGNLTPAAVVFLQNLKNLTNLEIISAKIGSEYCEGSESSSHFPHLYASLSRLKTLSIQDCGLQDQDLVGIHIVGATLETLNVSNNRGLTNAGLTANLKDLVNVKSLDLSTCCRRIDDLSFLAGMTNLEQLKIAFCDELHSSAFKVFSENPNTFSRLYSMFLCQSGFSDGLESVLQHLTQNNCLKYALTTLICPVAKTISETSQKLLTQLRGLQDISLGFELDDKSRNFLIENMPNLSRIGNQIMR